MPGRVDITIYRGDHYRHLLIFRDIPDDFDRWRFAAQIRVAPNDPLVVATFDIDRPEVDQLLLHTDADVNHSLYGSLGGRAGRWDLEAILPSGQIITILAGAVTVTADVTRLAGAPA